MTKQPSPIQRPGKLVPLVTERIIEGIHAGVWPPGATLPNEAALCVQFGVSRTVIREAMRVLEEKGILDVVHGRGTSVADVERWNLLDPMIVRALVSHDPTLRTVEQLQELRASVESDLAGRAATALSEADGLELVRLLGIMRDNVDDADAFIAADNELHDVVHRAADNPFARYIVRITLSWIRSAPHSAPLARESLVASVADHELLVEALRQGDPDAASRVMRSLVLTSWERRKPELLMRSESTS